MHITLSTVRPLSLRGAEGGIRLVGIAMLILFLVCTSAAVQAQAPRYEVVYSFTGGTDGSQPTGSLVDDPQGNVYGTTYRGGDFDSGVIFRIDPANNETVLYSFKGGIDGGIPNGGVIRDPQGNLYGTTILGGASGLGAVFELDTNNNEAVLHSFSGQDGSQPYAGLVRDRHGNLYGTTSIGGLGSCFNVGCGVVFKIDPSGQETVMHSFTGGLDGGSPYAGLILDNSGNLYGVTQSGGNLSACLGFGCGVVFEIDSGGQERVLYTFNGESDGGFPAGLLRDAQGNLYGTAEVGGTGDAGFVYKLSPSGTFTVLYNFTGRRDGGSPEANLVADGSGNLYGTTTLGGYQGTYGVVFRLLPSGKEQILHQFSPNDGDHPTTPVLLSGQSIYGNTGNGGDLAAGIVFKLSLP